MAPNHFTNPTPYPESMTSTRTLFGFHAVIVAAAPACGVRRSGLRGRHPAGCANARPRCPGEYGSASRFTPSTPRGSPTLAGNAPHQGVVAIVDAQRPHVTARRRAVGPGRAGAAARARRRHRSAQSRRLPAQRRCVRRAGGDRAEGPCGRAECHGREGGQRRRRDGAGHHGHQSVACAGRPEAARRMGAWRRRGRREPVRRRRRPDRWRGCSAPKARGCAGSPANAAIGWSASRWPAPWKASTCRSPRASACTRRARLAVETIAAQPAVG